jgi:hypothetical protein
LQTGYFHKRAQQSNLERFITGELGLQSDEDVMTAMNSGQGPTFPLNSPG